MNEHVALSASKRELLERMMRGGGKAAEQPAPIVRRAPDAPIPLSADQRQLWLHALMAPEVPLYNESITIHRFGSFDRQALERGFNELLRRHEAWRTEFAEADGTFVQRVRPHRDIALPFDDVSHLPAEDRDSTARQIATEDARCPIDLAQAPLLRARIVKIADDDHRLYVTLHHIIFDGVSLYRVVLPELAALYDAFASGRPSPLPEPDLHYGDYAVWQQAHLESAPIRRQVEYWRTALADAPTKLEIAGDRPRPARPSHAGSMEVFTLPHALVEALKRVSRAEGVTLYMTLLASYHALLHRYTGADDIVVGGVTDLRRRPELERVVGYFLNGMPLRARPRGDLPFTALLRDVRDSVLGALANSEAPLDDVAQALGARGEPGRNPLFNCLFSIQPPVEPVSPEWDLTQMDVDVGGAKFDLYLELEERPGDMLGRFLYSTELFDRATIRRMIGHWQRLLGGIVEAPDCAIRDLPLLRAEEHADLAAWNATATPLDSALLPAALSAQARAQPDAVALRAGDRALSWRELDARANAIAAALAAAGHGRGDLIAVCVDRSPDMVAALLAVHRIGAAYLPLDPDFPAARLAYIVEDAAAAALLTQTQLLGALPGCALPRILIDEIAPADAEVPTATIAPGDLAYVLYTSGSTGNPKGVEISHGALMNLLAAMRDSPGFGPGDSMLAVTTLSFDIAALEIFLPLLAGGTLLLAPRSIAADPRALRELIEAERPSVMQATPATWRGLIDAGWQGDPQLRILCGGEAFPRDLAHALLARAGAVWNMYGPTETTIWSTIARVTPGDGPVPIGRPIANTTIHILDPDGNAVPVGVVGELHIGGAGLAKGYRNRPDLTAERFLETRAAPRERLYRTGDLARYRVDGTILCLGRVDNDEKIRGYRVAVEEIEAALLTHPAIAAAAVRSWPDASGERALAAYVVASQGPVPERAELRAHLVATLPDYMIPAHFEAMDALPMTPNGKVDRKNLPPPGANAATAIAPPEGETETRLAAIWSELLRVEQVDRDTSFFDLGGHSLLVARLLVRIEAEWGRRIAMAEFFRATTIRALAACLDEGTAAERDEFVPLQPHGDAPPIIWLDGGPTFLPLAQGVGENRPFLGLMLGPILARIMQPDTSFEAIAAEVVAIIRSHRPHGPYLIGGWCTNGILAFEVARQLREAGESVPLLALGHAQNPVAYQRITPMRMRLSKAAYHLGVWRRLPLRAKPGYALDRLRGVLEDAGVAEADRLDGEFRPYGEAMERAAYRYSPGSYDGAVALFQPEERLTVLDGRPGWEAVVRGPIEAHDIPGSHGTMIAPPNIEIFAARLREAIDRACPADAPAARPAAAA